MFLLEYKVSLVEEGGGNIKKLIIGSLVVVALVIIGFYLHRSGWMFGPKPTVLVVNSNHNREPKVRNAKITNKNDVQKMYQILNSSPKLPSGPISCPSNNGISYNLTFKSNSKSTNISVEPTGCQIVRIGKERINFLRGVKADEFWSLLSKNLKINKKTLENGNEQ